MGTTNIDAKWMLWIKDNLERGSHAAELGQIIADNFSISVGKAAAVAPDHHGLHALVFGQFLHGLGVVAP